MKSGDKIIILPSCALTEMKLDPLAGLTATIVEANEISGNIRGCWVNLPGKYLGEREWYIPYNSIGI